MTQDFLTFEELWGEAITPDNDPDLVPHEMWEGPEVDTPVMNDWPLYHVFVKWAREYWDPDKKKAVIIVENEACFVRAPKPGLVMDYWEKVARITGDEIMSWDAAYIPEEGKHA